MSSFFHHRAGFNEDISTLTPEQIKNQYKSYA
jgi:predicted Zn-dependent peptidase